MAASPREISTLQKLCRDMTPDGTSERCFHAGLVHLSQNQTLAGVCIAGFLFTSVARIAARRLSNSEHRAGFHAFLQHKAVNRVDLFACIFASEFESVRARLD